MWLDQAHGGVLRVAATDSSAVTAALGSAPDRAHIAVVPVDRSLQQLDALAADVQGQVGSNAQVSIDVTTNQVAVYQVAGAVAAGAGARTTKQFAAAQKSVAKPDPRVAAVVAAHSGVVLRQLVTGTAKSGPAPAARPIGVPQPVGAGSKLIIKRTTANTDSDNENTMYGECTLGFVVYDSTSAGYYALTAGHCVIGTDKTGINHAYDQFLHPLGLEDPTYQQSTYPTDYALITIPDAAKRYGDPLIRSDTRCIAGPTACGNLPLQVTGVHSYSKGAGVGDVVCAIGRGDNDQYGYKSSVLPPGTRCGQVTSTNGGFVTDICSRKGDSGGPLFSEATGLAYGILNDGSPAAATCGSSEWSQYSPVSAILTNLNQQGSGSFVVRNVP
jgi:streptogrisin C